MCELLEHGVAAPVDAPGLVHGAVVHPDDDVLLVPTVAVDGHRAVVGVEDHQRAGGVQAQAAHLLRVDAGGAQCRPYGSADRLPDVFGGLLDVVGVGPPELDGMRGGAEETAVGAHHAGAGAGSADVDAQIDRGLRHPSPPRLPAS